MLIFPTDVPSNIARLPVCGVMAVSVITKRPFQEVFNFFATQRGSRWKGSLTVVEMFDAFRFYGVKIERSIELTRAYHKAPINKFIHHSYLYDHESTFFVDTYKHVQVVRGNQVVDQGGIKQIGDYRWKRKRIVDIYRVVGESKLTEEEIQKQIKEIEVMNKKVTKFERALQIVPEQQAAGAVRKVIIAKLADDLETTWASAQTFYYRVLNEQKKTEANKEG